MLAVTVGGSLTTRPRPWEKGLVTLAKIPCMCQISLLGVEELNSFILHSGHMLACWPCSHLKMGTRPADFLQTSNFRNLEHIYTC